MSAWGSDLASAAGVCKADWVAEAVTGINPVTSILSAARQVGRSAASALPIGE